MVDLNKALATSVKFARLFTHAKLFNGGTTGQVLTKDSNTDDDFSWQTPATPSGVAPTGGTLGEVLSKDSSGNYDYTWKSVLEAMDDDGDYEIGAFTPALTTSSGSGSASYTTQAGRYVVIGDLCHIWGQILLSNWTRTAGNLQLTGLPFTSYSGFPYEAQIRLGNTRGLTFTGSISMTVQTASTIAEFFSENESSNSSQLDWSDVTTTARFWFTGAYLLP